MSKINLFDSDTYKKGNISPPPPEINTPNPFEDADTFSDQALYDMRRKFFKKKSHSFMSQKKGPLLPKKSKSVILKNQQLGFLSLSPSWWREYDISQWLNYYNLKPIMPILHNLGITFFKYFSNIMFDGYF